MVEILKHGTGSYYKLFRCKKCDCIFKSTEYRHNVEYGYVARCPECNVPNVSLTKAQESEVYDYLGYYSHEDVL